MLLLLAIEKAYDTLWHNGLIYKLHKICKLPPYIVTLIRQFIRERSIIVKVNEHLSQPKSLSAGVPQEAILSPTLYNLFSCDVSSHPTVNLLLYADDTVLYGQSFYAQTAAQKVRYYLTKLTEYYNNWKITINKDKIETITFTRKYTNIKTITKLKLDDTIIGERDTVKYLGVTLDKRLCFGPHITNIINRTYATMNRLYPLINRRSKLTINNKLMLHKTIFRPIMTYAYVSWNFVSDTQCKRLQTTQNKLLRMMTNTTRYTSTAELHRNTKIPMLRDFIAEKAQKFLSSRIQRSTMTADVIHVRDHHNMTHTHKLLRTAANLLRKPVTRRTWRINWQTTNWDKTSLLSVFSLQFCILKIIMFLVAFNIRHCETGF